VSDASGTPTEATGNYAELLQNIGAGTGKAINTVSSLIGTVADFSAVGAVIDAIISTIEGFLNQGGPDQVATALNNINSAIQNAFRQLNKDLLANQILTRNSMINGLISNALARLQGIDASVHAQPPLSQSDIINQIKDCVAALDAFAGPAQPDLIWNLDYNWQLYWTDGGLFETNYFYYVRVNPPEGAQEDVLFSFVADTGYGIQVPMPNADGGTVFAYSYSLPTYVYAVYMFLAVGRALDPNFVVNYRNVLQTVVKVLQEKHDNIVQNGITRLSPPPWTPANVLRQGLSGSKKGIRNSGPGGIDVEQTGAIIEYGTVDKFSGYNLIVSNYEVDITESTQQDDSSSAFNKLQVRILKTTKSVYVNVGLLEVWNLINRLKLLLAEPPLPGRAYSDWSFRELFDVSQVGAVNGALRLKDLANLMRNSVPLDTDQSLPYSSFRELLHDT
jgi:hypothetical protein